MSNLKKFLTEFATLIKLSYTGWKTDRASRMAAALAYYTIFSLAPLLMITIAIASLIWQREVVQAQLMNQIQSLVGIESASFVAELLESSNNSAKGITTTVIGIFTLLFGALGVFNELQNALNTIWKGREEEPKSLLYSIKELLVDRFLSFAMILAIGFMLLVSLVISTGITILGQLTANILPFHEFILQAINFLISMGIITVLFAMIFKFLPDVKVQWKNV
jgi:membrane protein